MIYPIILAGGQGTRLWPASTKHNPKQVNSLLGKETLLAATFARLKQGFRADKTFVVTSQSLLPLIKRQIPAKQDNFIIEPEAKGTSMAIGLAAAKLETIDQEAIMFMANTDHYIKEVDVYLREIKRACELVAKNSDQFVLLGIKPRYPDTGLGYIELGKRQSKGVYDVASFKEKPNLETAKKYLKSGKYLWNAAMFVFKAKQLLIWYKEYLPDLYQSLIKIQQSGFKQQVIANEYATAQNIAIDYGLLEKMSDMLVMPVDFTWADIGYWNNLRDVLLIDKKSDNIANTKIVSLDSKNNLLYSFSGKLIAAIGVENVVLVETDEAILLCPADRAQDIKILLAEMKKQNLEKYL